MSTKNSKTKLAIAGAGMTGAYLYRLLSNEGQESDIFDIGHNTKCGLTPCAWGTSGGFAKLVEATGLEPQKYILRHLDHVLMDEVKIKAELMTFDKPRLVKDLLKGAEIKYSPLDVTRYDRIIDATGVSRAFLPTIKDDIILECMQCRVKNDKLLANQIKLGSIGYAWCFPLSGKAYHIGCGSLVADPHVRMEELGWLGNTRSESSKKAVCECTGKIRLSAPQYSQPFVVDEVVDGVWGIGEAIGCVAPLAGDGIVPGMRSVQILINKWDDPGAYTQAILREFHWMKNERNVIDKLRKREHLGIRDAWVLKKNSKRMGMQVGFREAAILIKRLR